MLWRSSRATESSERVWCQMILKLAIIGCLFCGLPYVVAAQQPAPPLLEQVIEPSPTEPSAPIDSDALIRRDYEFAERVGTKEAWRAFLAQHGSGYYAELARAQLGKLNVARPNLQPTQPPTSDKVNPAGDMPSPASKKSASSNPNKSTVAMPYHKRCMEYFRRRQGGRFVPEGQSTSCMWGEVDGRLQRLGTCMKSRSDANLMCRHYRSAGVKIPIR